MFDFTFSGLSCLCSPLFFAVEIFFSIERCPDHLPCWRKSILCTSPGRFNIYTSQFPMEKRCRPLERSESFLGGRNSHILTGNRSFLKMIKFVGCLETQN